MSRSNYRMWAIVSVLVLSLSAVAGQAAEVTVLGAAGEVAGSMTLVEAHGQRWLVDCGIQYGEEGQNRGTPAIDERELPRELNAVFLTHAHLDHAGRLPELVRGGFNGPIYVSHGTAALLPEMMEMVIRYEEVVRNWRWSSARVSKSASGRWVKGHWDSACRWRDEIAPRNRQEMRGSKSDVEEEHSLDLVACKVCLKNEVAKTLRNVRALRYGQKARLGDKALVSLLNAGHIPGSSSVLFEVEEEGQRVRYLFSGDLGSMSIHMLEVASPPPAVDTIWLESTYGGESKTSPDAELKKFRELLAEVLKKGHIAWIPAFALDRTQKVLFEIGRAQSEGTIVSGVKILCPSPSGQHFNQLYQQELKRPSDDPWFAQETRNARLPSCNGRIGNADALKGPAILITSSGMMDAGGSESMLHLLRRSDVSVFIVGYQAPGTPGDQLLKRDRKLIEWNQRKIPVRALATKFSGFSGHLDFDDSLRWLSEQPKNVRIYLVHGEPRVLRRFRTRLTEAGFTDVRIAVAGMTEGL